MPVRTKNRFYLGCLAWAFGACYPLLLALADNANTLPGTKPLLMDGDIASQLVDGVDRFLLRQIEASVDARERYWKRDFSSAEAYNKSIEPNRHRLAHILGVRDARIAFDGPELVSTTARPALVAKGAGFEVFAVRWPAFGDVSGEGLLLVPTSGKPVADVVAIPDCNQTPEQLVGLEAGVPSESQFARRLAESGCRVIVPVLINRQNRMENLTNREWLYRSAFELGRGLVGYEVQKVLACVDWFSKGSGDAAKVGVVGWGEGGLVALYAGALDNRIDAVAVSGYFDNRNNIWQEPIDRNVFGLLEQFGDAELANMIAPRALVVEAARGPEATIPGGRGAPARVVTPEIASVRAEFERAQKLLDRLQPPQSLELVVSGDDGRGPYGTKQALTAFLTGLESNAKLASSDGTVEVVSDLPDSAARNARQRHELDRHSKWLLGESQYVRKDNFWNKLNYESLEKYTDSIKPFRKLFAQEVIGRFDTQLLPPNVCTRRIEENEKWTRYEVVMDVFPDVIAYGLLTLPKGIQNGERRPVVVCQHGLEGRPQDTIGKQGNSSYKAFNTELAERGFITFSPQNLYIFGDRFRTLQRKANPIKKTLFSIIVPQHQQIVDWLQSLPQVDPDRVAFYGLSYGGKTAMRVPPLVTDYCLSICSADFNEWVDKNASTRNPHSYASFGEYEIFEFDLGSTFNYAEMAALVAPRPFMVERGHYDGVASDETVAWEYAKVRFLYAAKLKIPDRTEIEWFDGPHTINGVGTYAFLHRHLNWPEPETKRAGAATRLESAGAPR
ncbi:MAG TPA: dienelactone hydrolase family protein [Lacipirellulaceae bacterium]|nr:dienelactone hydrolase family protein [Lacipirellulaceae bacterium]